MRSRTASAIEAPQGLFLKDTLASPPSPAPAAQSRSLQFDILEEYVHLRMLAFGMGHLLCTSNSPLASPSCSKDLPRSGCLPTLTQPASLAPPGPPAVRSGGHPQPLAPMSGSKHHQIQRGKVVAVRKIFPVCSLKVSADLFEWPIEQKA